jgi:dTDP-4-dehydrorhamnose reductase
MRILITGADGQLGRALQGAFAGDEVHAAGHAAVDVADSRQVSETLASFRPDAVVHAAAWTDTAGCERDPERALRVNGEGAGIVAEECGRSEAIMIYVSSNEVFDGEKGAPYTEEDVTRAINAYGASKLEGERRVRAAGGAYCIVRTSWLYGPGRQSFPEKIMAAAERGEPLRVVTDEIASPTYTADLAEGIARLTRGRASGVFHLTNEGACSRFEWAKEILRLAGVSIRVEAAKQADFGAPFRKPANSTLANREAARMGIRLRPWGEALAEHMRARVPQGAPS